VTIPKSLLETKLTSLRDERLAELEAALVFSLGLEHLA
jgi:hypothetical protein